VIHLDTNVAIALLNDRQPQVRARFDAARTVGAPLGLSIIVYHELMYGAAASERRKANEDKIALFVAAGRLTLSSRRGRGYSRASQAVGHSHRPL
jgi:tRNA(fMet)-specific endonuclease VapC